MKLQALHTSEICLQVHVLEPTDIFLTYSSTQTAQELAVDFTDINFNLSPDIMQLIDDIRQSLLEPLSPPPADRPLCAVSLYTKVRNLLLLINDYVWSDL